LPMAAFVSSIRFTTTTVAPTTPTASIPPSIATRLSFEKESPLIDRCTSCLLTSRCTHHTTSMNENRFSHALNVITASIVSFGCCHKSNKSIESDFDLHSNSTSNGTT
jgi:hypothetical protein